MTVFKWMPNKFGYVSIGLVILLLALSAPAQAGSLTISATDSSGRTSVTEQMYPTAPTTGRTGSRTAPPRSTPRTAGGTAQGSGQMSTPEVTSQEVDDAESILLFKQARKIFDDLNRQMDDVEQEFKKDAAGMQ